MIVAGKRDAPGAVLWIATAATLAWVVFQTTIFMGRWPGETLPESPLDVMGGWWIASWVHLLLLTILVWRLRASRWRLSIAGVVLILAAAARIAVVLNTHPAPVDDMWRYLHDGQTLLAGRSPYASAPAELSPDDAPMPELLPRINNPELATIYQPGSQLVFTAVMALRVEGWDPWGDRTWRLAMVGFDLLVVVMLLWRMKFVGRTAAWALLYAWHPLPIAKIAGSGHQDVVGIGFMIAGLLCCEAVWRRRDAWAFGGGVTLALAAAIKPYVLLVVMPAAWFLRRARPILIAAAAGAITLMGLYLPFALSETGLNRMIETGSFFNEHGNFNGSLHALLLWFTDSRSITDGGTAVLLLATITAVTWSCMRRARREGLWLAATGSLLAGLLLASIVHPWYVLWALAPLPLVCAVEVRRRFLTGPVAFGVWWLAATIPLTYVVHLSDMPYRVPGWVLAVEYGPIYAAMVLAVCAAIARGAKARS